jgi:heme/copper-type cytochrome/quinol oxidase subunit 2
MTEPTADPAASTTVAPVEPVGEVARKNIVLALALVGVVVLIVLGTIAVSLIYLHYD